MKNSKRKKVLYGLLLFFFLSGCSTKYERVYPYYDYKNHIRYCSNPKNDEIWYIDCLEFNEGDCEKREWYGNFVVDVQHLPIPIRKDGVFWGRDFLSYSAKENHYGDGMFNGRTDHVRLKCSFAFRTRSLYFVPKKIFANIFFPTKNSFMVYSLKSHHDPVLWYLNNDGNDFETCDNEDCFVWVELSIYLWDGFDFSTLGEFSESFYLDNNVLHCLRRFRQPTPITYEEENDTYF